MPISFKLNGQRQSFDADPAMPLLWLLRDVAGLTGTKYGCGAGFCGACTVHLDGKPVRSCQLPSGRVAGHAVTTIEGLSADRSHPVQRAWIAEDVPQCGYCQAGQIMSAVALLAETPKPTVEQIDSAMSGNLCRCGTSGSGAPFNGPRESQHERSHEPAGFRSGRRRGCDACCRDSPGERCPAGLSIR